jgi:hypothetical protein
MADTRNLTYGMLAEFDDPAELVKAAEKMNAAGYKEFDCHSPFPIHGMDKAMGLKRSPVGYIAGIMGLIGGVFGLWIQYYASTVAYPLVISGKPFFSYQAFVPVTFGLTILFAALGAFFGMLMINRLPRLFHGIFYTDGFAKISNDGFFVSVEAKDARFSVDETRSFLESIGGRNIEVMEGP